MDGSQYADADEPPRPQRGQSAEVARIAHSLQGELPFLNLLITAHAGLTLRQIAAKNATALHAFYCSVVKRMTQRALGSAADDDDHQYDDLLWTLVMPYLVDSQRMVSYYYLLWLAVRRDRLRGADYAHLQNKLYNACFGEDRSFSLYSRVYQFQQQQHTATNPTQRLLAEYNRTPQRKRRTHQAIALCALSKHALGTPVLARQLACAVDARLPDPLAAQLCGTLLHHGHTAYVVGEILSATPLHFELCQILPSEFGKVFGKPFEGMTACELATAWASAWTPMGMFGAPANSAFASTKWEHPYHRICALGKRKKGTLLLHASLSTSHYHNQRLHRTLRLWFPYGSQREFVLKMNKQMTFVTGRPPKFEPFLVR